MILYKLNCGKRHEFDSWFRDSKAFERQAARGLSACPSCGDTKIERALMAPRISKAGSSKKAVVQGGPPPGMQTPAVPGAMHAMVPDMPAEMRAALQQMRKKVEENCDYVGENFAEEARKIHYGETDPRAIYGEASDAEAEALNEEGIEFNRIPWLPRTN